MVLKVVSKALSSAELLENGPSNWTRRQGINILRRVAEGGWEGGGREETSEGGREGGRWGGRRGGGLKRRRGGEREFGGGGRGEKWG